MADDDTKELLAIDFAKAEERVLAHRDTTVEEELARIYNLTVEEIRTAVDEGADLYKLSAAKEFGVPVDQVTAHQKKVIKLAAFNKLYGGTDIEYNPGPGTGRIRERSWPRY